MRVGIETSAAIVELARVVTNRRVDTALNKGTNIDLSLEIATAAEALIDAMIQETR